MRGSKLGVRGIKQKLGEQAGGFLRPQGPGNAQGARRSEGSKLGVRGASSGLPEAPGRFQGPRDAQEARRSEGEQAGSEERHR